MSPMEGDRGFYGSHRLIGRNNDAYFDMTPLDKALEQGRNGGCPVAERLTKEPSEGGRGAVTMMKRYGQVNFWAGYINQRFNKNKRFELSDQLLRVKDREPGEEIGTHDESSIPSVLHDYILVSPELYGLPRMVTTYIDDPKIEGTEDEVRDKRQKRMFRVMSSIDRLSETSSNIRQFTVKLGQSLAGAEGDPKAILKAMLSNGKLGEDNCHRDFEMLVKQMSINAPSLWRVYSSMTGEERIAAGIADINIKV